LNEFDVGFKFDWMLVHWRA